MKMMVMKAVIRNVARIQVMMLMETLDGMRDLSTGLHGAVIATEVGLQEGMRLLTKMLQVAENMCGCQLSTVRSRLRRAQL